MQGAIEDYLRELHARLSGLSGGALAAYIPELAHADPNALAIAIATVDGALYAVGDVAARFTIQSISKPFTYAHVLEACGPDAVLARVGVEPTGEAFNAIELDQAHNRAFNPMVNTGAIAACGLIEGDTQAARRARLDGLFARFAGRPLDVDEAVYASESATGHRNRAMAWLMLNSGIIDRPPEEVIDLYFRQCSLLVDVRDLALMGATLANGGVHPRTAERALDPRLVGDVLTVMNSCGMYNYAGQWAFEIGLPAKSGVSGAILAVAPGQAGIAIWSPPIDATGTSVRGAAAARAIAADFGLRSFDTSPDPRSVIRRAFRAGIRSKRARPPAERRLLANASGAIALLELQGPLFFGSAERLIRRTSGLALGAGWIILDFAHVLHADHAARALLARFRARLAAQGRRLLAANLAADGPLAALHADFAGEAEPMIFASRDRALEFAEDRVLARLRPPQAHAELALDAMALLAGLDAGERGAIAGIAAREAHAAGARLARRGEPGDDIFLLAQGHASVFAAGDGDGDDGETLRVGALGPGMAFGEMALIDGAPRYADVVADEPVVVLRIAVAALRALGEAHPRLLGRLYANMARELSERLQRANAEIRALEA